MRSHAQWESSKLFFKGCLGGVDNTLNTLDYNVLADFHGYTFITQTFINYNKVTPARFVCEPFHSYGNERWWKRECVGPVGTYDSTDTRDARLAWHCEAGKVS